jgi:hypothetical protein
LLNGLKVLVWSDPSNRTVDVSLRVHAGSAFDPQGKEGVMELLAASIFPNATAREFFAEELGGSLKVTTSYDYIEIDSSSTPEGFISQIETLAAAVSDPDVGRETTATLRSGLIERVKILNADPQYVADRAVARRLFGTHPYGRPTEGTVESLQRIDFTDLVFARDRFFRADNATLVIRGPVTFDRAYAAARRYFGSWLRSDKLVPSTFRQPDPPAAEIEMVSLASNRTEVRVAVRGAARNAAEHYAYATLAEVLRERAARTLGNSAAVRYEPHVLPGTLVFALSAANEPTAAAKSVDGLLSAPVSPAEFDAARSKVLAALASQPLPERWLDVETYQLGSLKADNDRSQAVTISEVQKALDSLRKESFARIVVHPAPAARAN